jgi:heme/copper-type cytochrome/quinol oxidase subunit 3
MRKAPFSFDEREKNVFRNVCTVMYLITLFALMSFQLYRQFVLHQPHQEWDDIAMLMTINVIVLLGAVLYLTGAVNPKKIRRSYLIAGYVGFVLLGFAFTVFKYTVILGQQIGLVQVWDYLLTVILISGVLAFALGILAYLGSRRIDKQIE